MGLDFMEVSTKMVKKTKDLYITEVYPDFLVGRSKDLMIRGGDLYAVWDEEKNIWLTDENDILPLIDWEIKKVADELKEKGEEVQPLYLRNEKNKMIYRWHSFCQKAMKDNFHQLDNRIIFDDKIMVREDYATKCLPYHLSDEPTPAYNELTSVLYSPNFATVSSISLSIILFNKLYS